MNYALLHHLEAALVDARVARDEASLAGRYALAVRWARIVERLRQLIELVRDELIED